MTTWWQKHIRVLKVLFKILVYQICCLWSSLLSLNTARSFDMVYRIFLIKISIKYITAPEGYYENAVLLTIQTHLIRRGRHRQSTMLQSRSKHRYPLIVSYTVPEYFAMNSRSQKGQIYRQRPALQCQMKQGYLYLLHTVRCHLVVIS